MALIVVIAMLAGRMTKGLAQAERGLVKTEQCLDWAGVVKSARWLTSIDEPLQN